MKYKLAVFDMDGTILDTLSDLTASTNYALKAASLPEKTREDVRRYIGDGVKELIERACAPVTDEKIIEKVFVAFSEYYKAHGEDLTRPYPGIVEAIKTLRANGIKTGVVSNKLEYAVIPLAERYFPSLFDYIAGDKEGVRRKPYPDPILNAISAMGETKETTVYIGDSDVDVKAGFNAGVDVISAGWGYRSEKFLLENGAKNIVFSAEEMLKKILES